LRIAYAPSEETDCENQRYEKERAPIILPAQMATCLAMPPPLAERASSAAAWAGRMSETWLAGGANTVERARAAGCERRGLCFRPVGAAAIADDDDIAIPCCFPRSCAWRGPTRNKAAVGLGNGLAVKRRDRSADRGGIGRHRAGDIGVARDDDQPHGPAAAAPTASHAAESAPGQRLAKRHRPGQIDEHEETIEIAEGGGVPLAPRRGRKSEDQADEEGRRSPERGSGPQAGSPICPIARRRATSVTASHPAGCPGFSRACRGGGEERHQRQVGEPPAAEAPSPPRRSMRSGEEHKARGECQKRGVDPVGSLGRERPSPSSASRASIAALTATRSSAFGPGRRGRRSSWPSSRACGIRRADQRDAPAGVDPVGEQDHDAALGRIPLEALERQPQPVAESRRSTGNADDCFFDRPAHDLCVVDHRGGEIGRFAEDRHLGC
jgi:hypothetical protein